MSDAALKCLGLPPQCLESLKVTGGIIQQLVAASQSDFDIQQPQARSKEEANYVSDEIQSRFLPEIIFEILSWLPAKSLLRMRCVCKSFHCLIQQRCFIEKHICRAVQWCWYNRTPGRGSAIPPDINFAHICGIDGLFFIRNRGTGNYYIANPTTRQTLQIPKPQINRFCVALSFVPSIDQYKLVSVYYNSEKRRVGYQILSVGIDNSWRTLAPPPTTVLDMVVEECVKKVWVVAEVGVAHFIKQSENGSSICWEIVYLDLESESFAHVVLPRDLFPLGKEVWPFNWNGQLAFAYRMQKDLYVLILENYKKPKWGETKIVVPLKFAANNGSLNELVPLGCRFGDFWFLSKKNEIFSYNIASEKISSSFAPPQGTQIRDSPFFVNPESLVTLKGMQSYV